MYSFSRGTTMQKMQLISIITGIACSALLMVGCCSRARNAGGQTDHCNQGMKYWNDGNYVQAEKEFTLARSLDSNYAPAYSGLALTAAQAAKTAGDVETSEKGFKKALKLADMAVSLDSTIPDVFIARAIVITMKNEGKEAATWLNEVENEYGKALKRDRKNAEAFYRRGLCYKKAYEFSKAADDFRKVLKLKKGFTTQANKQLEIVQKIERSITGTDMSKRIAFIEQMSRADIAALFVSELHIGKLIDKKASDTVDTSDTSLQTAGDSVKIKRDSIVPLIEITDIDGHWAEKYIIDIVERGIRGLEIYPDHTFRPDRTVNRGEFALMVDTVLTAITGGTHTTVKQDSIENRFPDVTPSHPAYNAICNTVDRGIMDMATNGEFGPDKPVSGPDALLTVRNLKFLWLH